MAISAEKRHDFLWIVQMYMQRDPDVLGWGGFVGDAVAASYLVPKDLTARDAANDFWGFFNEGFGGEANPDCPSWMRNLEEPSYR